jgi:hypothetical protein
MAAIISTVEPITMLTEPSSIFLSFYPPMTGVRVDQIRGSP